MSIATEEPRTVEEAMTEVCWREAMQAKMLSIESNRTWEMCDLPSNHKSIGLK